MPQPASTSPTTRSPGTNTSSKKVSANSLRSLLARVGRTSMPGESRSIRNMLMPRWPSGPVRTRAADLSDMLPKLDQSFCP